MNASLTHQPLAARMRPNCLMAYVGQEHFLAPGKPLRISLDAGRVHSMIFWGPPGVGKTTLAHVIANSAQAEFYALSAVSAGVKEIRGLVEQAKINLILNKKTVVFIDEVHRFNKSQQDALLPHVEDGTFILLGATTENPSFELNNALLSRVRVYVLKPLSLEEIRTLLLRALTDQEKGLGLSAADITEEALTWISQWTEGDVRRGLNLLEWLADARVDDQSISLAQAQELAGEKRGFFDKGGDIFYEQISALHKAVRGSSPDGALYWLARMLEGGCDPLYIARRVVRMASEDIGNADPRGIQLALNAWDAQERLGSPEGELTLAQAVIYLACAPKSNAVYNALKAVKKTIQEQPHYPVPDHICNAPTQLLKQLDKGKDYRYAHDEVNGYVAGESYLPEALTHQQWYQPSNHGLEQKIKDKLNHLKKLDKESLWRRYGN